MAHNPVDDLNDPNCPMELFLYRFVAQTNKTDGESEEIKDLRKFKKEHFKDFYNNKSRLETAYSVAQGKADASPEAESNDVSAERTDELIGRLLDEFEAEERKAGR